jgi:hypothetical protein
MWTERKAKCHFALITVRIGLFPLVIFFPLRCLAEVIEGFSDILCLVKNQRVFTVIAMLEYVYAQIREYGPLDLADIDIKSPDANVRVRVLMR